MPSFFPNRNPTTRNIELPDYQRNIVKIFNCEWSVKKSITHDIDKLTLHIIVNFTVSCESLTAYGVAA